MDPNQLIAPPTDDSPEMDSATFAESERRSAFLHVDIEKNPTKYRVLSGERPTGSLHIGHYFGMLKNRVDLQNKGLETFVVIADYQVLTDRDSAPHIAENVEEVILDNLCAGMDPFNKKTRFFCHSHVPSLNQLLIPFLTLVSVPELERNPTVKEEIKAANLSVINACLFTYPVHQAADILFCKGNVVPVGRDQLPHLELSRKIARRFNERFCPQAPVFPQPDALLSETPKVLGLDGDKMSKSRNNAILLKATADETAQLVKKAKTDSQRQITYDPQNRPEVSNLLKIMSLCTGEAPETIAERIGDGGGGTLKKEFTTVINDTLAPMRARRAEYSKDRNILKQILRDGHREANEIAEKTLAEVRKAMNMSYGL